MRLNILYSGILITVFLVQRYAFLYYPQIFFDKNIQNPQIFLIKIVQNPPIWLCIKKDNHTCEHSLVRFERQAQPAAVVHVVRQHLVGCSNFVKFHAEGDFFYCPLTSAVHATRGNFTNWKQIIQICFLIIWIKFVRFLAEGDLHYRPLTSAVHASRGNSSNCNQIIQICFLIIWIIFVRFLAEGDLHYRPLTSAVHASRGNSSNCNQIIQICFFLNWMNL